jgi:putative peptidoglycan lipid II flippase
VTAGNILRSAALVGGCTGLSRLLGFVREVLMAVFFGTTLAKSAFDVAFRIPNLFRRLFGEGALSAAFVPVFSETLEKEGLEAASVLAGRMFSLLLMTLTAIAGLGMVLCTAALLWLPLGAKAAAVLPLLRIMLPYMVFICLVALCMGILNALHHFTVPALTPLVLNIVWIAVLVTACRDMGTPPAIRIRAVAWAVVTAGVLQLAVQVPVLRRFGLRPRLTTAWRGPRVRRTLLLMGPAALGMGVHQLNVVIDGLLALAAGTWAPAALTYAERLIYLPLGLFGTALGTVLLPTFSRRAARDGATGLRAPLREALQNLLLVMVPAAVGLGILALPVVELSFVWKHGAFDGAALVRTARAVAFYAPGLLVFSFYKALAPAFYALQDTRTPVRIGMGCVGLNLVLNILFVVTWAPEYKHAGLAFATVLSSAVNALALARVLHGRIGDPGWRPLAGLLLRVLASSALMAVVALSAWRHTFLLLAACGLAPKGVQLASVAAAVLAGLLAYAGAAGTLCRHETAAFVRGLRGGDRTG